MLDELAVLARICQQDGRQQEFSRSSKTCHSGTLSRREDPLDQLRKCILKLSTSQHFTGTEELDRSSGSQV